MVISTADYIIYKQTYAGGFEMVKAVVGANWGDEGKGKITDMLGENQTSSFVFKVVQMQAIHRK